jgi:hypothetical protein
MLDVVSFVRSGWEPGLQNRIGGVSLRVRTRSLTLLDGLPGCVGREFRAPVPRRDRDAARAFAANLNDLLADRLLRWLDDDHPDLPRLQ